MRQPQSTKEPLDFCLKIRTLCEDITRRMPEFQHILLDEVAISFAQTRSQVEHGMQAKLTPMRFHGGSLTTERYGQLWTVQRLFQGEHEFLYILTFYLPRFLNMTFREKMVTILHELYHISPAFDGDLRRYEGRYHVHSHSQKAYDEHMERLLDQYLKRKPNRESYQFLRSKFSTLIRKHGSVVGVQIPIPKLIPLPGSRESSA